MAQSVSVRTLIFQETRYIICENGSLSVSLSPCVTLFTAWTHYLLVHEVSGQTGITYAAFASPCLLSLNAQTVFASGNSKERQNAQQGFRYHTNSLYSAMMAVYFNCNF